MKHKSLAFLILICFSVLLFGQNPNRCGTDQLIDKLVQSNPSVAQKMRDNRSVVRQYIQSSISRAVSDTIITIPVVVHVIHSGQPPDSGANISNAQILSQIAVLNACFNKQNADTDLVPCWYKHLIANVSIKFCLAMYDPSGDSTTGITRDSFPNNGQTYFDNTVKPATQWDPAKYYNIWVTDLGNVSGGEGDVLGYSTMPSLGIDNQDGVVINYPYFGRAPFTHLKNSCDTLGKTAVHETGHWLGLYHTFYDGCANCYGCAGMTSGTCDTTGDFICDTPPEGEPTYGCSPNLVQCTCSDTSYYLCICNTVIRPAYDMWMDYMDYVDDNGLLMFTPDQAAEMRGVLNTLRLSIQYSTGAGNCKEVMVQDTVKDTMGIAPSLAANELNIAAFPNPTTGTVDLQYSIPEKGMLEIFNVLGELILTKDLAEIQKAMLAIDLNARPSGIYLIRLQTLHSQKSLKLSIVR